jgi:hypothetical protein
VNQLLKRPVREICRRASVRAAHREVRGYSTQEIQPGHGRDIVAPPRKQVVTEKTNFFLQSRKTPVYSNKILSLLKT